MKYVYIDLGAYNGDTFLSFMSRENLPIPPEDFEVYLVEPNPFFGKILQRLFDSFPNITQVINAAAWIKDGEAQFAQDTNDLAYGSTLIKSKVAIWDVMPKIKVKTFDLSKWLKQFRNEYVIVKMDIEGAEFPVLNKMLKDKTIKYMDELWIELHPNKVRDVTSIQSNELIEEVGKYTKVTLWH